MFFNNNNQQRHRQHQQPRANRRERNQLRNSQPQTQPIQHIIRFVSSWRLNIFIMFINLVLLVAYSLIICHNSYRDQSFTIDHLMDNEKFPLSFHVVRIKLVNLQFFTSIVCHSIYVVHKYFEHQFLEWKKHSNGPQ